MQHISQHQDQTLQQWHTNPQASERLIEDFANCFVKA
jgi:hypothetical protein